MIIKTINKVTSTTSLLPSTLLDLTRDTVNEATLARERTAHNSEGEPIVGQLAVVEAEAWARGTRDGVAVTPEDPTYHNNSMYYANVSGSIMRIAGQSALSAATSAIESLDHSRKSQSYATGDAVDDQGEPYRPGQDEDCSKYYYEQAKEIIEEAGLDDFSGATATTDGTHGLMIQPKAGDQGKVITGNAKWTALNSLPEIQTINGSISRIGGEIETINGSIVRMGGEIEDVTQQIQAVDNKVGLLSSLATTVKTNIVAAINEIVGKITNKVLFYENVACSATTGNFATVSNSAITADHVVTEFEFDNPSAISPEWSWVTAAGSLTLNGTCSAATTVTITLVKKDN